MISLGKASGKSVLTFRCHRTARELSVDVLMQKKEGLNCTVYALSRMHRKGKASDFQSGGTPASSFIPYDINKPFVRDDLGKVDYVLHLASNTHPVQYATDPIGTITTNIIGLQNMLDFAVSTALRGLPLLPPMRSTGKTGGMWSCFPRTTAVISTVIRCGQDIRRASAAGKRCVRPI